MAEFKPIRTISSKVNTTDIPIDDGQIIFALDTKETWIDRNVSGTGTRDSMSIVKIDRVDDIQNYEFSALTSGSYSEGDIVHKDTYWYARNKVDGSDTSWDATHWEQISPSMTYTDPISNNYSCMTSGLNLSNSSFGVGEKNFMVGFASGDNFISGQRNAMSTNGCINNLISGRQNRISGSYGGGFSDNIIGGYGNQFHGNTSGCSQNIISGNNNSFEGCSGSCSNIIEGSNNSINGMINDCVITGSGHSITGSQINGSFIGGLRNTITANSLSALTILGRFNEAYSTGEPPLLVIGNGDVNTRSNILEVTGSALTVKGDIISPYNYLLNWIANTSYKVNHVVIYNSCIYRCTTANTDAAWDSTKWDLIGASQSDITAIESTLDAMNDAIEDALAGHFT